jgi:hypothetical protein
MPVNVVVVLACAPAAPTMVSAAVPAKAMPAALTTAARRFQPADLRAGAFGRSNFI